MKRRRKFDTDISNNNFRKRRASYDWDKLIDEKTLKRHQWLAETWRKIYSQHPNDLYIRKLSTDDLLNTKWYEKYGVKEPNF